LLWLSCLSSVGAAAGTGHPQCAAFGEEVASGLGSVEWQRSHISVALQQYQTVSGTGRRLMSSRGDWLTITKLLPTSCHHRCADRGRIFLVATLFAPIEIPCGDHGGWAHLFVGVVSE